MEGGSMDDMCLVFDAETGKYREERKYYNPNDTSSYHFFVDIWDGEESVSWIRQVSTNQGHRALGADMYEHPGTPEIKLSHKVPDFVSF